MRSNRLACAVLSVAALVATARAGIRAAGRYSGVVVFDRWGGCILSNGWDFNYVSESAKAAIEDHKGEFVELDATDVDQPINPGEALIKKFTLVGLDPARPPPPPNPLRLSVRIRPDGRTPPLFEVEAMNAGDTDITLRYDCLAVRAVKKRVNGREPFCPGDGPSAAVLLAHFMNDPIEGGPPRLKGGGVLAATPSHWQVMTLHDLPREVVLNPRHTMSLTLSVTLPAGEYDLFAAYSDFAVPGSCTASNLVGFDVAANGQISVPKVSGR